MDVVLLQKKVVDVLANQMAPEGVDVTAIDKPSNNGVVWHGIRFCEAGSVMGPVVYLEEMTDGTDDVEQIAKSVLGAYRKAKSDMPSLSLPYDIQDFGQIKDRVYYTLLNGRLNHEIQSNCPYIPYLDLIIVFRIRVNYPTDERTASILVNNALLSTWGITVEELYEVAKENTPKLFPATVDSIGGVLAMMMDDVGFDFLNGDMDAEEAAILNNMLYIVSNKSRLCGAGAMLYDGLLRRVSDNTFGGKDLCIFPSSIHEVLLKVAEDIGPDDSANMVQSVNGDMLKPEDILSDHAYIYDREKDEIRIWS